MQYKGTLSMQECAASTFYLSNPSEYWILHHYISEILHFSYFLRDQDFTQKTHGHLLEIDMSLELSRFKSTVYMVIRD